MQKENRYWYGLKQIELEFDLRHSGLADWNVLTIMMAGNFISVVSCFPELAIWFVNLEAEDP